MSVREPNESQPKTPEWLELLENKRKRPHKLAHDIGAGAPCMICKDGCQGLNLHFWRKLCIECKCRKEDHDVEEENEYSQFEILFGAKRGKRTSIKLNASTKSFDWVPPNAPQDLVIDYLKSIPESKLPISNSGGARYRKQQLEKQVPLHDVDPNACHNLSALETAELNKYLDNLKNNVIGQGKIIKFQPPTKNKEIYKFNSLVKPLTPTEDHLDLQPQCFELWSHLAKVTDADQVLKATSEPVSADLSPKSHLINGNASVRNSEPEKEGNLVSTNGNPYLNPSQSPRVKSNSFVSVSVGQNDLSSPVKIPSADSDQSDSRTKTWNRPASAAEDSDKSEKEVSGRGGNSCTSSRNKSGHSGTNTLINHCHVDFVNNSLNQLKVTSQDVPFLPVQQMASISPKSKGTDDSRTGTQDEIVSNEFPEPPATCQQCLSLLNPEEIVIRTERAGDLALWHANCFVCETCRELLVDLIYFFHKGKVYCGRHYAEIVKIPRCYACDELIFVKEYTCAEGETYHIKHFCCFLCDEPLAGKQYVVKDSNPACLDCYQAKFGKKCQTCCRVISACEQRVSWKNLDFHVSATCFRCTQCKMSLLGGKFVVKSDRIFCNKNCVSLSAEK